MANHSTTVDKIRNLFNRKARKRGGIEGVTVASEDGDDAEEAEKSSKQGNSSDDHNRQPLNLSKDVETSGPAVLSHLSPASAFNSELLNAPISSMNQKRSSFQITSVITNLEAETVDDCYESADDLDEPVSGDNQDVTSEISAEDATEDADKQIINLANISSVSRQVPRSASCLFPMSSAQSFGVLSNTLQASSERSPTLTIPQFSASSILASGISSSASTTRLSVMSSLESADNRPRFRIVKLKSAQPFSIGRWTCVDYLDSPSTATGAPMYVESDGVHIKNIVSSSETVKYAQAATSNTVNNMAGESTNFQAGVSHLQISAFSPTGLQRSVSMQSMKFINGHSMGGELGYSRNAQVIKPSNSSYVIENLGGVQPSTCPGDSVADNLTGETSIVGSINHSSDNVHNISRPTENSPKEINIRVPSVNVGSMSHITASSAGVSLLDPDILRNLNNTYGPANSNMDLRRAVSDRDIRRMRGLSPAGSDVIPGHELHAASGKMFEMGDVVEEDSEAVDENGGSVSGEVQQEGEGHLGVDIPYSGSSLIGLGDDDNENSDEEFDDGLVRIESKITEAMDLVKRHLMYTVNEEVTQLQDMIRDLRIENQRLFVENTLLRSSALPSTLARLQQPGASQLELFSAAVVANNELTSAPTGLQQ